MQGNIRSRRLTKALLIGSSALMAGLTMAASSAYAQDSAVSEVVVTGSRIAKRDFTSSSPIVTVGTQQLESTSNIAIEATLNKLPQFTASANLMGVGPGGSGDIQPTAVNAVGISTASLRGLGPNRNLVLLDGRRLTPVNGLGVVDLNSVPSAAIDHIEVITGGASAVYGADAIAGVVNFILKKDFQGVDMDVQYGGAQAGDDKEFKASLLVGTNFADDKGNVMLGVEHYTRSPTYFNNRDFYSRGYDDPSTASNAFFMPGAGYVAGFGLPGAPTGCPDPAVQNAQFGAPGAGSSLACGFGFPPGSTGAFVFSGPFATEFLFNGEGAGSGLRGSADTTTMFPNGGPGASLTLGNINTTTGNYLSTWGNSVVQQHIYDTSGGQNYGGSVTDQQTQLKSVDRNLYLLSPLSRWSAYSAAHYDFNENLSVFVNANFTSTSTRTRQVPAPAVFGWGVLIPFDGTADGNAGVNPSQHPVPQNLADLLNSRGLSLGGFTLSTPNDQLQPWQLQMVPGVDGTPGEAGGHGWLPHRATLNNNTVWQITGGFNGTVPGIDWTWELQASHGQSEEYTASSGNVSLERYRAIVLAPNYGENFYYKGNQASEGSSGPGFGAGTGTCTSGFYETIFHNGRPSQDCIDSITANLQSYALLKQEIVEFNTQGGLFDLPAGQVRASLGASYRESSLLFTPDTLQSQNSFLDQLAGLYPAGKADASVQAKEGYGELLVPVLSGVPFVKQFDIELGARYSTYSNADSGWTYKILGDWQVNDWARFRGGYNVAVRAPGIGETFLPLQEVYNPATTQYGDPCSLRSSAPFGAGGADNATLLATTPGATAVTPGANAANAYALCQALMGPTGAAVYYAQQQAAPGAGSAVFVNQIGNPNLQSEKGVTWTAGVVLQSPARSPWLDRLTLALDWYKITVSNAIAFSDIDFANALCLNQDASTPGALATAVATVGCQGFLRNPATGAVDLNTLVYGNLAWFSTSGVDLNLNWGIDFESVGASSIPGAVNLSVLASWMDYYKTQSSPTSPIYDWKGTLGPNPSAGLNPGAFKYKVNTTLAYLVGPATVAMTWRHRPSLAPLTSITTDGVNTFNTTLNTPSHDEFDLAATWKVKENYILRAGVDNLFDKDPPITAATTGAITGLGGTPTVPNSGQGTTVEGLYDALGRRFYIGLKAKF
jgi:outer membrane receptor protein involved in Fe transport